MKNRFIIQRDKYSCGPIAVMNLLRWADPENRHFEVEYRDIDFFRGFLNANKEWGTTDVDLDYALKTYRKNPHFSLRISKKDHISMREIEKFVSEPNRSVIFHYNYIEPPKNGSSKVERDGHYVLVVGMDDYKNFLVVNMYPRAPALRSCPREDLALLLRYTKPFKPFAWFIERKGY